MIIPVKTGSGNYNIILQCGAIAQLSSHLKLERKALIVTDDGVPPIYAQTVANQCKEAFVVTLPQGDASKSFENYKMLYKFNVTLLTFLKVKIFLSTLANHILFLLLCTYTCHSSLSKISKYSNK